MFNVTRLVHLAPGAEPDAVLAELRAVARGSAATRALVEPTLPGVRNGGDILVHLRFPGCTEWNAAAAQFAAALDTSAVVNVDGAEYEGTTRQFESAQPATVYRTLLLRVADGTTDAVIERFEADLCLLPRYVRTITGWQLSRVEKAIGASAWTHVFEQDFSDLDGLMGPYLMHPIHWSYVDRWFDPECPDIIVRDRVCHSFCRIGDIA
jgi:Stress responsive A/B Barrel Domain